MSTPEVNVRQAVGTLEDIKRRKGMFFTPDVEAAENFLAGFLLGLIAAGVPVSYESWRTTLQRRGWRWDSCGVVPSMKAKGLKDEEIADELIESLAEELRRISKERADT